MTGCRKMKRRHKKGIAESRPEKMATFSFIGQPYLASLSSQLV
jgi:hypothetical protein